MNVSESDKNKPNIISSDSSILIPRSDTNVSDITATTVTPQISNIKQDTSTTIVPSTQKKRKRENLSVVTPPQPQNKSNRKTSKIRPDYTSNLRPDFTTEEQFPPHAIEFKQESPLYRPISTVSSESSTQSSINRSIPTTITPPTKKRSTSKNTTSKNTTSKNTFNRPRVFTKPLTNVATVSSESTPQSSVNTSILTPNQIQVSPLTDVATVSSESTPQSEVNTAVSTIPVTVRPTQQYVELDDGTRSVADTVPAETESVAETDAETMITTASTPIPQPAIVPPMPPRASLRSNLISSATKFMTNLRRTRKRLDISDFINDSNSITDKIIGNKPSKIRRNLNKTVKAATNILNLFASKIAPPSPTIPEPTPSINIPPPKYQPQQNEVKIIHLPTKILYESAMNKESEELKTGEDPNKAQTTIRIENNPNDASASEKQFIVNVGPITQPIKQETKQSKTEPPNSQMQSEKTENEDIDIDEDQNTYRRNRGETWGSMVSEVGSMEEETIPPQQQQQPITYTSQSNNTNNLPPGLTSITPQWRNTQNESEIASPIPLSQWTNIKYKPKNSQQSTKEDNISTSSIIKKQTDGSLFESNADKKETSDNTKKLQLEIKPELTAESAPHTELISPISQSTQFNTPLRKSQRIQQRKKEPTKTVTIQTPPITPNKRKDKKTSTYKAKSPIKKFRRNTRRSNINPSES